MLTSLLHGSWVLLLAALPAGNELHYTGKLQSATDGGAAPDKTFSLTLLSSGADQLDFLIDERGAGGWGWPQRFGRLSTAATSEAGIRLLYLLDGAPTPLPVRTPLFEDRDRLVAETEWMEGNTRYACIRTRMVDGVEVAEVEVALDRGRHQRLQVERETGVVIAMEERLFLGRGEPFQLALKLESRRTVPAVDLAATIQVMDALTALQSQLPPPDAESRSQLNAAELVLVQQAIAALPPARSETVWSKFVTVIQRDLVAQNRRLEGVAGLRKKFLGQPAAEIGDQKRLDGQLFSAADLNGHTTVLHFWEYNGDRLVEPYGQVGYLDYLHQRRGKLGARVIGVAVDARLADAAQSRAAQRVIRKFREFMNVSFPIAIDDGTLLTKFGDPRAIGSELPLWVVIGHDGTITHYAVGHYDLKPDEGLRELDAAVVEALKREKAAARQ